MGARFPDFFVIGAAKAGSTALWNALRRHPDLFFPEAKEPSFFAYKGRPLGFTCPGAVEATGPWITAEADYLRLFRDCPPGARAGEASIGYLSSAAAPGEIAAAVPHARLVAILRHPVDRAFSHFRFFRQLGWEPLADFEAAVAAAPARLASGWRPGWDYLEFGRYGTHLDRWRRHFDERQLLVLLYEDWRERPQDVIRQVCHHIGVEALDHLPVRQENATASPRWPALRRWLSADTWLRRMTRRALPSRARDALWRAVECATSAPPPRLDPAARTRLLAAYAEETARVEALIGRDLEGWRS